MYETLPGSIGAGKAGLAGLTKVKCLPFEVKNDLVAYHIFNDIGQNLETAEEIFQDRYFLSALKCAMKPRFFRAETEDAILAEENSFVPEALYVQSGIIEVGFSRLTSFKTGQSPHIMAYRQMG